MSRWVTVGFAHEIPDQGCKIVEIDRVAIAIFNLGGDFFAIEDNCPHQHLPLADGLVEKDTITCPYHNAKFDIKTGHVLSPPACEDLHIFPTRLNNGSIEIEV